MQTTVKKWLKDKDFGFLDNGGGPDIFVRKADLINCQYLKVGATVEFECQPDKRGLIARKVKLINPNHNKRNSGKPNVREPRIGVMT